MIRDRVRVLEMETDPLTLADCLARIHGYVTSGVGAYVCLANVHMCMECHDDKDFARIVNGANLVVADGKPIAIAQRISGAIIAQQIRGADLTRELLGYAESEGWRVGFFGGTQQVIESIVQYTNAKYPALEIALAVSPPFGPALEDTTDSHVRRMNECAVQLLLVGLGCPKQETWMAHNHSRTSAVMVGVGAAFEFLAGAKSEAPRCIRVLGLEWFFRLLADPRRLAARYLLLNPRFLINLLRRKFL